HLVVDHADGVTANLDLGVIGPGAVLQAEAPGVPGAGDHPFLDPASAQRSAHVWAHVVDGVDTARGAEDGEQLVAHLDGLPLVLRQVADPAHRLELAHTAVPRCTPTVIPAARLDGTGFACHDYSR